MEVQYNAVFIPYAWKSVSYQESGIMTSLSVGEKHLHEKFSKSRFKATWGPPLNCKKWSWGHQYTRIFCASCTFFTKPDTIGGIVCAIRNVHICLPLAFPCNRYFTRFFIGALFLVCCGLRALSEHWGRVNKQCERVGCVKTISFFNAAR